MTTHDYEFRLRDGTGIRCVTDSSDEAAYATLLDWHGLSRSDVDLVSKAIVDCLDARGDLSECSGEIQYRDALSSTGRSFPRCDRHWGQRLVKQERINRDYPDSQIAPSWFDPSYAGERWNEE